MSLTDAQDFGGLSNTNSARKVIHVGACPSIVSGGTVAEGGLVFGGRSAVLPALFLLLALSAPTQPKLGADGATWA